MNIEEIEKKLEEIRDALAMIAAEIDELIKNIKR